MGNRMPDLPNIQREVLEYALEHADGPHDVLHLRDSPLSERYGAESVGKAVQKTGVFNWGINALHPWYEDESEVRSKLAEFDG